MEDLINRYRNGSPTAHPEEARADRDDGPIAIPEPATAATAAARTAAEVRGRRYRSDQGVSRRVRAEGAMADAVMAAAEPGAATGEAE